MRDKYRYIKGNPIQTLVEGNVFQAESIACAKALWLEELDFFWKTQRSPGQLAASD